MGTKGRNQWKSPEVSAFSEKRVPIIGSRGGGGRILLPSKKVKISLLGDGKEWT